MSSSSAASQLGAQLTEQMTAALQRANAEGIVLTDHNGLCLGSRGTGRSSAAPFVASIAGHAKELGSSPQIVVESDQGSVFIQSGDAAITAIFKSA